MQKDFTVSSLRSNSKTTLREISVWFCFMKNIDFHSHILPKADHGSDNIETSVFQIKHAVSCGIDTIIATPHFYPHRHTVGQFLECRARAYDELLEAVRTNGYNINIISGAEVLICDGLDRLPGLSNLCIGNTKTLLLELPFSDFHSDFPEVVSRLISGGFGVILAHADRYSPVNVEKMIEAGATVQLNVAALSKFFLNDACLSWIERGLVVGIGSDIHQRDVSLFKKFKKVRRRFGPHFEQIMIKSSQILKSYT